MEERQYVSGYEPLSNNYMELPKTDIEQHIHYQGSREDISFGIYVPACSFLEASDWPL